MHQKFIHAASVCLLIAISLLSYPTEARNLYSIIAADTDDHIIGDSVLQDFTHVRKKMQEIANYLGIDLKEISIRGEKTKPSILLATLNKAPIQKDDVVVFYYSGHGYRTQSKGASPWPNLYFSTPDQGIKYELIMELLADKHPRFLLTMVDVCNSFCPESGAPPLVTRPTDRPSSKEQQRIQSNYRHLFLDLPGSVHITSSAIGEYSYGYSDGGLYTNAFLSTLTYLTRTSTQAEWGMITHQAAELVEDREHPHAELWL
ncbi:MAG: caspase family protein [Pseudomonadota bacterium]|nr:caspase family protein [Pseudomonadota bacterium]